MAKLDETTVKYATYITRSSIKALESVFTADFPIDEYKNLNIASQWANKEEEFPMVMVRWHPSRIFNAGVGNVEMLRDSRNAMRAHKHFLFEGQIEFVLMALSVVDAYLLLDQVSSLFAFGTLQELTGHYWYRIFEDVEYGDGGQLVINGEELQISPLSAVPVPWGSEDRFLYQISVSAQVFGGFYSQPDPEAWAFLDGIVIRVRTEQDPEFPGVAPFLSDFVSEDFGYVKGEATIVAQEV